MRQSQGSTCLGQPSCRRLLRAGSGLLALMAAGGLFGGRVAQARALESPAAVPAVDKLAVRVATDSYHHAFEPSRTTAGVQVQRMGYAVSPRTPPQRTLQNEWGLAWGVGGVVGVVVKRIHRAHVEAVGSPNGQRGL